MPAEKATNAGGMSPLARLLRRLQSDGLTWSEMQFRARQAGHRYSDTAFEQVAKDERAGRLDINALKAIAAATGETVEEIARLDDLRWGIVRDEEGREDDARHERPPNMSDKEWDQHKRELNAYHEFLLNKAAQQR